MPQLPVWRLLLFALMLSALVALVLTSLRTRTQMLANTSNTELVTQRLTTLSEWRARLVEANGARQAYLATRNPERLEAFESSLSALSSLSTRARAGLAANSPIAASLDRLNQLSDQLLAQATRAIALAGTTAGSADSAGTSAALEGESQGLMDELRFEFERLQAVTAAELGRLRAAELSLADRTSFVTLLLAVLGFALLFQALRQAGATVLPGTTAPVGGGSDAAATRRVLEDRSLELSQLATHLQELGEREKSDLARNLHDELGGLLTAAKMDLAWLQGRVGVEGVDIRQKLQALESGLTEAMNLKRRVVENLRPALLDHFGLPTALQALYEEAGRRAQLEVFVSIADDMACLPSELAITLFRVGQEALTNILRHAQAHRVDLIGESTDAAYTLSIQDDGKGMPLAGAQAANVNGLSGMRHRIARVGGTLEIRSSEGQGTTLLIVIPRLALRGQAVQPAVS